MFRIAPVLLLLLTLVPFADARGRTSSKVSSSTPIGSAFRKDAPFEPSLQSPQHGAMHILRARLQGPDRPSTTAKHDFQKSHPCPATGKTSGACKGYVIDHVVPLNAAARMRRATCSGRRSRRRRRRTGSSEADEGRTLGIRIGDFPTARHPATARRALPLHLADRRCDA